MENVIRHTGEPETIRMYETLYRGGTLVSGITYHVANKGDLVFRLARGFYSVSHVTDEGIPTLSFQDVTNQNPLDGQTRLFEGLAKISTVSDAWMFINYDVEPPVATLDTRVPFFGDETKNIKVFLGTDISEETGQVISGRYNTEGGLLSETIDLYKISETADVYRPYQFNVPQGITEKHVVTVVGYNELGGAVAADVFLTRHDAAIAPATTAKKYATGIQLITKMISTPDPRLLVNIMNIPPRTSNMQCKVKYSDGTFDLVNIDGNKVRLAGIDAFNYKLPGSPGNLTLIYYPNVDELQGPIEPAINVSGAATPKFVEPYQIQNSSSSSDFALKMYILPEFVNAETGYKLNFMLGDDDHGLDVDVTAAMQEATSVTRGDDQAPFLPLGYGIAQELTIRLEIDNVLRAPGDSSQGMYPGYVLTQKVLVTLGNPNNALEDRWTIDYNADGFAPLGVDQKAQFAQQARELHIKGANTTFLEFMENNYWKSLPLYDEVLFSAAPAPTHIKVETRTFSTTIVVADWDKGIPIPEGSEITADTSVNLTWISDTGLPLYLAFTAISLEMIT